MSCSVRTDPRCQHPQGPSPTHPALQRQGAIRCSLGIGEELDAVRVAAREVVKEGHCTIPDDDHASTEVTDLGLRFEDVSNLLTTEESAEVTDKHQDGCLL